MSGLLTGHIKECCVCGDSIDTREEMLGGSPWAAEVAPGLWVCSGGCAEDYLAARSNFCLAPDSGPATAEDIKAVIADTAKAIVRGARRGAYGTPEQNFERIARFWTAYFQNTGRDVVISASDVSPLMRLMKEARLCETPDHFDSHVDLAGYTLTGAEVNGVRTPEQCPE